MSQKAKIAVVTGCSHDIGLATSKALIQKGAKVAGWNRSPAQIINKNLSPYKTDISNIESVKHAHKETLGKYGPTDFLINNAGIGFVSDFEDLETERVM